MIEIALYSVTTSLGPEGVRYSEKLCILTISSFPMGNMHAL